MSGPSEKAAEAAWGAFPGDDREAARGVLMAAHDPALGEDASVRLGDAAEWIRQHVSQEHAHDFLREHREGRL